MIHMRMLRECHKYIRVFFAVPNPNNDSLMWCSVVVKYHTVKRLKLIFHVFTTRQNVHPSHKQRKG